jgi:hypothetical protein
MIIYHISPNLRGCWNVRKHGASKAWKVFKCRQQAIDFTFEKIKDKSRVRIVVHDKDGRIR